MKALQDVDLVVAAKTDRDAMAQLFEGSTDFIWFVIHQSLGNDLDALRGRGIEKDDIFQEATLGFLKGVRTYDPGKGQPSTWIAFPVRHAVIGLFRRRALPVDRLDSVIHRDGDGGDLRVIDMLPSPDVPQDRAVEREVARAAMRRSLSRLTPIQRRIVVAYLSGMNQRDAAKTCGVSQSYASRIVARFRDGARQVAS